MAYDPIFYTESEAKDIIELRSNYYAQSLRDSSAHAWLHRKMAYAEASAKDKKGKEASLIVPTGGGIKSAGLYSREDAGVYPKPHIESVSLSNAGDYGSIEKCIVRFTVYSINQLGNYQPFFDLGGTLTVKYGWNDAGGAGGNQGAFTGVIFNFSYSLNADGGFDCTSEAMAEGSLLINGDIDASGKSIGKIAIADVEIVANSLSKILQFLKVKNKDLQDSTINLDLKNYGGVGKLTFSTSFGSADKAAKGSGQENQFYISLEALVQWCNDRIQSSTGEKLNEFKIVCNGTVTQGFVPISGAKVLVSGNPKEIIFPGCSKYEQKEFDFGGAYSSEFQKYDLSKIMINIDWLISVLSSDEFKTASNADRKINASIAGFFNKVFDAINVNSGTRFKLSITQNPKNTKEFYIVDTDYLPEDAKVKATTINPIVKGGVCRSMNLTSKVPSGMATAAFIGGSNTFADGGGFSILYNGDSTPAVNNTDAQTAFDIAKKKLASTTTVIKPEDFIAMQAAIKNVYLSEARKNELIPMPIELSFTIDGILGFIFGNIITTDYLPDIYKRTDPEIVFMIKSVEQEISANDWTTTITTVCRGRAK